VIGPRDIEALVERYLTAHAACELETVVALFRVDATLEDPVGSDPFEGQDAIRAFYVRAHQATGVLRMQRVGPIIVCGHEATAHVRAAAESTGFDPAVDVIYTLTCDANGRIARLRAFFDLSQYQ
jgi:steroid delta-isomerase